MSVRLKNVSPVYIQIKIYKIFNNSQLYSKNLAPQQLIEIPIGDLKKDPARPDPGAVLLVVRTSKTKISWKGPVPISSDSVLLKINAKTNQVFYGKMSLPSIVPVSSRVGLFECCFAFIVFIIILWILVVWSKKLSLR